MELEARYAREELAMAASGRDITLRIGAGPIWSLVHLPEAMKATFDRFPDLHCTLEVNTAQALLPKLETGDLDIVLGAIREDFKAPQIVSETLATINVAVCCAGGHPVLAKSDPGLSDLQQFGWVLNQQNEQMADALSGLFKGWNCIEVWHRNFRPADLRFFDFR